MFVLPQSKLAVAAAMLMTLAVATLGCRREEEIHSYVIPKETVVRPVATTAPGEPTDRMLAAILPDGDKAWFFKIVGPVAAIDARADDIQKFFTSIRPAAGKPVPSWELSGGWSSQPASGMRAATILVPTPTKPLELTVTSLPWMGAPGEVLSNVNRWRGQLQLAPTDEKGLADNTRTLDNDGTKLTVVDLHGQMGAGGMMPPFAGGAGTKQPPAPPPSAKVASPSDATQLPPGHPPVDGSGTPATTAGPSPLKFETPSGWTELPAGGMRKAAFGIDDGEQRALVTVIDFPVDAGPMMADALENVNRWRREVGLDPIAKDALDANTSTIQVDGVDARYMEAVPDAAAPAESQANRATLAAMVRRGNLMWFIKLTGDRDLATRERDNFRNFLDSLEFTTAGGATNGN